MKKQPVLKKGRYVLCRYNGDNGDLIAGRVESVRTNGDVICKSLLNGARHVKLLSVFKQRNVLVTKGDADKVVAAFKLGGKKLARVEAVKLARAYGHVQDPPDASTVARLAHTDEIVGKLKTVIDLLQSIRLSVAVDG
jgi:hypothetical protein